MNDTLAMLAPLATWLLVAAFLFALTMRNR